MSDLEGIYPNARARWPTLRQSTLSTFDNCALSSSFELEYRKGWSSHPQARGQLFHRFAAECLRTMASVMEDTIPVDAALAIMREVLTQEGADRACRHCGSVDVLPGVSPNGMRTCGDCGGMFETEFVNVPMEMVKDLHWCSIKWAQDNAFPITQLAAVERRLETVAYYHDHVNGGSIERRLTGQIDAMFLEDTSHAIVDDWKDTWALPPEKPEEGRNDTISDPGYFQQRFYALLVFKTFPTIMKVTLRENYIRYGQSREASITVDKVEELEAEFSALAKRFDRAQEESLHVPTPGKHCNWCIRPSVCPVIQFARGEGRIVDMARAEKVAASLIVAEKVVKDNRAALRAFADVAGPIPVKDAKGDRQLGYVESERVLKPTMEQIEKAELEKGAPLTLDEIRKLFVLKRGTRFQAHVPVPVDPVALAREDAEAAQNLRESLEASIEAARSGNRRAREEAA